MRRAAAVFGMVLGLASAPVEANEAEGSPQSGLENAPGAEGPAEEQAGDDGDPERRARFVLTRVAVYDFELNQVSKDIGSVMTQALLDELRKRKGLSVVGMNEIEAMLDLEAQKQVMGCSDDEGCLAEIADALGVDSIVIGSLALVGDSHVVAVRRIDQRDAKVAGSYTQRLAAEDGVELLATIGPMVPELFPGHELRPGETAGVDPEVALRLNPPPLSPWLFYGGAGGAATLAAGAAVLGVVSAALFFGPYSALVAAGSSPGGGRADELLGMQQIVNLAGGSAWVLGGVALLVGISSAALIPLSDFKGYGDAAEGEVR